jgi:hypothetical protein
VALQPRLSPGVPLSGDGKQELGVGTGNVNKASPAKGTMRGTVLTADELERLASGVRAVGLRCRVAATGVPAVARLRDPHFEHDPAGLSEVPQHVDPMVKGQVRGNGPSFRLEHDGRVRRGDLAQ